MFPAEILVRTRFTSTEVRKFGGGAKRLTQVKDSNICLEYEHIVLLELLKKGHLEPEKKIGNGIKAFQVRFHPQFRSRCFFVKRDDESVYDFSFRKCVDHILPLPENMQTKDGVNKALSGGGRGGRGRGCGRGHGGGW